MYQNISRMSSFNGSTLDHDAIRKRAPSVFAEGAHEKMSSKYLFVPTIEIIKGLEREGFRAVMAGQTKSRSQAAREHKKHMLRFRHESLLGDAPKVGGSIPELVLTNSHDGSSAFQLSLGMFRIVCLNGLVAGTFIADERVKHSGDDVGKVIEATYRVLDGKQKLIENVESFQGVELSRDEQIAFARSALPIRWDMSKDTVPEADKLLSIRRMDDKKNDLWTVFNRVQENMIKGGLRTRTVTESGYVARNSTRSIESVNENKRVNQALWTLAEEMKKLKSA